jgi:pSer/pThr/pTyr-binding forkhead associated (FHA) protein
MSGPLQGTVRAITDDPLSLGRDAANQVMIGDSAVSRKHCTISQISQGVYEICDHDSHNGTLVNGIRISHTPIRHGDRIRVGTSEFVFLVGQDDDASPQSPGAGKHTTNATLTALFLDQRSGLPSDASGIGRMKLGDSDMSSTWLVPMLRKAADRNASRHLVPNVIVH